MGKPLELKERIEVDTALGRGYAVIFESDNDENFWTVIINHSRAFVTFKQREIRVAPNYTWGMDFPNERMLKILGRTSPSSST